MSAFHDVRLPLSLSRGAKLSIEHASEIVTLASGREVRNARWSQSRRTWNIAGAISSKERLNALIAFFEARRGMLNGFRWKDWADFKSCAPSETPTPVDQPLGVGDGAATSFALKKVYLSGPSSYERPISKPAPGSVFVAIDGVGLTEGADYAIDAAGMVTLAAAPAAGAAITAGFEFDVPVRFDTERIEVNLAAFEAGEIPSIPIIEIRV